MNLYLLNAEYAFAHKWSHEAEVLQDYSYPEFRADHYESEQDCKDWRENEEEFSIYQIRYHVEDTQCSKHYHNDTSIRNQLRDDDSEDSHIFEAGCSVHHLYLLYDKSNYDDASSLIILSTLRHNAKHLINWHPLV